jgi:orotidine-5'-phosphate decarboxylase
MQDNNRIIIALDMDDQKKVLAFVKELNPAQCRLKIGKELFTSYGPKLVKKLQKQGFSIFLDLKFHDIPNTVYKAVRAACQLNVWMLTIHTAGGSEMMRAARRAVDESAHKPILVAVTVLTSLSGDDLNEQGIQRSTDEQVLRLASLAQQNGMDGVVCSAAEAASIRKLLSENFVLVTPGIRPTGDEAQDQKRVVTPKDAISAGSNFLVIGRPITQARKPVEKLHQILDEISGTSLGLC